MTPSAQMPETCPVCGAASVRPYRHAWLTRCGNCGVLAADFPRNIPDQPGDGGLDEDLRAEGLASLRLKNNAALLATLAGLLGEGRHRLLDVGCGPGFLLSQAAELGFEAQGVEPDANVLAAARGRGVPVRQGYFPVALARDETFDAIVFNDVLEHIPDVRAAIAAASAHLRPGGVLCLNCPDRRGLFFRIAALMDRAGLSGPYDRLWQRGLPSPHLWYFTPANLRQATAPFGLTPARDLRLATAELKGLWSRIRMVRETPLPMALATWAFTAATYPFAQALPSDAVACFFRKGES
ncbi:class I SAM-dependent methyltransferase [Phenylobacterium sp.]|uniref:class I SAM-dependent methyltransferase n=1 Tax=Phenylobacterium sp. TaxID=1871053 RepID=UPI002FD87EA3